VGVGARVEHVDVASRGLGNPSLSEDGVRPRLYWSATHALFKTESSASNGLNGLAPPSESQLRSEEHPSLCEAAPCSQDEEVSKPPAENPNGSSAAGGSTRGGSKAPTAGTGLGDNRGSCGGEGLGALKKEDCGASNVDWPTSKQRPVYSHTSPSCTTAASGNIGKLSNSMGSAAGRSCGEAGGSLRMHSASSNKWNRNGSRGMGSSEGFKQARIFSAKPEPLLPASAKKAAELKWKCGLAEGGKLNSSISSSRHVGASTKVSRGARGGNGGDDELNTVSSKRGNGSKAIGSAEKLNFGATGSDLRLHTASSSRENGSTSIGSAAKLNLGAIGGDLGLLAVSSSKENGSKAIGSAANFNLGACGGGLRSKAASSKRGNGAKAIGSAAKLNLGAGGGDGGGGGGGGKP